MDGAAKVFIMVLTLGHAKRLGKVQGSRSTGRMYCGDVLSFSP